MNQTITLRWSTVLLSLLVAVAVVAAYLLGNAGQPVAEAATTDEEAATAPTRTLKLVGTGKATAVPDQASFALTVTAKRDLLEDALDASSSTMRAVLKALEGHGVSQEDVQTSGLSMRPEYDYFDNAPRVLTGYRVTQEAQVRITELRQAGRAMSTAIATGGNGVRVGAIALEVGDPAEVVAQARDDAVAEAMAKAEQYAEATGQSLGEVLSVREVPVPAQVVEAPYESAALAYERAAADAVPVRAGEDELSLQVEVVWSFD